MFNKIDLDGGTLSYFVQKRLKTQGDVMDNEEEKRDERTL